MAKQNREGCRLHLRDSYAKRKKRSTTCVLYYFNSYSLSQTVKLVANEDKTSFHGLFYEILQLWKTYILRSLAITSMVKKSNCKIWLVLKSKTQEGGQSTISSHVYIKWLYLIIIILSFQSGKRLLPSLQNKVSKKRKLKKI